MIAFFPNRPSSSVDDRGPRQLAAIEDKEVVKQPLDISLMPPRKQPTTKDDDDDEDDWGKSIPLAGFFLLSARSNRPRRRLMIVAQGGWRR
jgi:hypothetical protein